MIRPQEKALQNHRRRLKERGLKRVEVEAGESDAVLLRKLARMLRAEGSSSEEARQQLRGIVAAKNPGLKELLAAAPLDGIHITRSRDRNRSTEL